MKWTNLIWIRRLTQIPYYSRIELGTSVFLVVLGLGPLWNLI